MFGYIESFFSDPRNTLIFFLLAFPGRVLALSVHEFAHAWMANRCGDPTARLMGRMTINPLKHLDLLGTIMMLLVGYGWAKPVPVNPNNFRDYRKDDLKVSIAGVTMNFIMFVLSMLLMFSMIALALARIPVLDVNAVQNAPVFRASYSGIESIFKLESDGYYVIPLSVLLNQMPYASDYLIAPVFGTVVGFLYQMVGYFAVTNFILMVFNLLPVPPLDGYHVFNDLVLRRSLFVNARTAYICQGVMMILVFTGILGEGLAWVNDQVLQGAGSLAAAILRAMGLMS